MAVLCFCCCFSIACLRLWFLSIMARFMRKKVKSPVDMFRRPWISSEQGYLSGLTTKLIEGILWSRIRSTFSQIVQRWTDVQGTQLSLNLWYNTPHDRYLRKRCGFKNGWYWTVGHGCVLQVLLRRIPSLNLAPHALTTCQEESARSGNSHMSNPVSQHGSRQLFPRFGYLN
jgi:hypothetical protein